MFKNGRSQQLRQGERCDPLTPDNNLVIVPDCVGRLYRDESLRPPCDGKHSRGGMQMNPNRVDAFGFLDKKQKPKMTTVSTPIGPITLAESQPKLGSLPTAEAVFFLTHVQDTVDPHSNHRYFTR